MASDNVKRCTVQSPYICYLRPKKKVEEEDPSTDLLDHRSEIPPIKCSECEMLFLTKNSLNKHMKVTHKIGKVHKCEYCDKICSHLSELTVHIRSHTKDKPYTCDKCYKSFSYKNSLNCHILTHSTERYFVCPVCEREFILKHQLKKHMRVHTGEKPYVCPRCHRSFAHSNVLKYHISTHNEEYFKCSVCEEIFDEKYRWDYHLRFIHPEKL